ncbi:hypothetical protein Y032_0162g3415 [Ancylostoma ceylanicum]|uniref:Uncharacterized protein n=1 Tax=Ancylostoma ceylanicum TaxID=53326 RepID=A0A016SY11_9BILA|nr:hypothetical protein Y032_0162g3415 [Ancylostoma ceylanicum]
MTSVIGYVIEYATLRDARRKRWLAHLVSLGFTFMNASPGRLFHHAPDQQFALFTGLYLELGRMVSIRERSEEKWDCYTRNTHPYYHSFPH